MKTHCKKIIEFLEDKIVNTKTYWKKMLIKYFKMDEGERIQYNLIYKLSKRFFYTYSILTVIVFAVTEIFQVDIVKDKDVQNWASLVYEVGIGVYVSIAIITYENFKQDKIKKQQKKKEDYGLQKITLLLNLARNQFKEGDHAEAIITFDQIIVTLNIISEVLDMKYLRQILELSEIGKWVCKQNGSFSIRSNHIFPFTMSVPATSSAFFGTFDDVIDSISNKNKK